MRIKTRQGIYLCLAVALLFGILTGVAFPELFRMRDGTYAGFFSLYGMKKVQEMEIMLWPIFSYLLSSRLRTLLFLWMGSCTLPQWIFYGLQWKKELQLFLSHTMTREVFTVEALSYPPRRAHIDWIAMVLYCVSGCAAETFLGLWSVKIFLQILI